MNIFKSKLNRIALCSAIGVVGMYFLIYGFVLMIKFSNAHDLYAESYSDYLKPGKYVSGELWCVEACFATDGEYVYGIVPLTDEEAFTSGQDMKFAVYCFPEEKRESAEELVDYWNGVNESRPEDIELKGVVSEANEDISEGVYLYFEETYGFTKQETAEFYLPYVITEAGNIAYTYVSKLIVGGALTLISLALFCFLVIKDEKQVKERVFTEEDVP